MHAEFTLSVATDRKKRALERVSCSALWSCDPKLQKEKTAHSGTLAGRISFVGKVSISVFAFCLHALLFAARKWIMTPLSMPICKLSVLESINLCRKQLIRV